jgi:hypothetical protein
MKTVHLGFQASAGRSTADERQRDEPALTGTAALSSPNRRFSVTIPHMSAAALSLRL